MFIVADNLDTSQFASVKARTALIKILANVYSTNLLIREKPPDCVYLSVTFAKNVTRFFYFLGFTNEYFVVEV